MPQAEMPEEEMEVDERGGKRDAAEEAVGETATKKARAAASSGFDVDLLRVYYSKLFPFSQLQRWLSYGSPELLLRREFSFTLEGDRYVRYLSFRDEAELRAGVIKLQPHKIDIGAVYSLPPKNHGTVKPSAFVPVQRELVFDVDLTDYDDVRVGCTPDQMWERGSWLYMAAAIKVVDAALREDFGFEHLVWVFSGRRGVHCWVCDRQARDLEDRERTAVVNYLTLIAGGTADKIALSSPLHPAVQRAMPLLEKVFDEMVLAPEGQDALADEERWTKMLAMLPDAGLRDRLHEAWAASPEQDSRRRWKQLRATVLDEAKRNKQQAFALKRAVTAIVIMYTYPRLDVNVSTKRNHLLKSPFVVHPKTGKVCVPILDVQHCEDFDPDAVPTLASLVAELDATPKDQRDDDQRYRQTALGPFVEGFDRDFLKPMLKELRAEALDQKQRQEAELGVF